MALDRNDPYSAIPQLEKELKGKMSAQGEVVKKLEGAIDGYKKITNTIKHTLTENSATIEAIKEDGEEFRNEIKQDLNGISTTVQRINNNYVTQTDINQSVDSIALSATQNSIGTCMTINSSGTLVHPVNDTTTGVKTTPSGISMIQNNREIVNFSIEDGQSDIHGDYVYLSGARSAGVTNEDGAGVFVENDSVDIEGIKIHLTADRVFVDNIRDDPLSYSANVYCGTSGGLHHATGSSSSRRYKHDIEPLEYDAKKLYDIPVIQFKYNKDRLSKNDERYEVPIAGFIAEDIDEVLPILVDHDAEGKAHAWNPNIMIPMMLKLIQEQHEEIEELKAKVERLEK